MDPAISVILPIYNGAKYLNVCLDSIFSQTFSDFELIAVNDGSKDNSLEILKSYADPRLKVIDRANAGLAATLNFCAEQAKGTLLARMDQDDWMHPERLMRQKKFMDENPSVGLIGAWAVVCSPSGVATGRFLKHPTDYADLCFWLQFDSYFVHPSVMMRKSALLSVGGYSSAKDRQPEDYDLWSRLLLKYRSENLAQLLLFYRESEGSMSRENRVQFEMNLEKIGIQNVRNLQFLQLKDDETYRQYVQIGRGILTPLSFLQMIRVYFIHFQSSLRTFFGRSGRHASVIRSSMRISKEILRSFVKGEAR